jgi:hypothetical protein
MIILDTEQGSLDWITARLWRLTGSALKSNITATGALSKSQAAIAAVDKLIAGLDAANEIRTNPDAIAGLDDWQIQEWIGHYTGEKFSGNKHTRRGNDLEPDALAALQDRIGMQIYPVGMCIMGDDPNGVVSCSPDGLIYHDGILVAGAEVKCPTLATFYGYLADGTLPDEYKLQVHSAMAICEVDQWHFAAYFKSKPLFYVYVKWDKFTDTLYQSLQDFRAMYEERFWEISSVMKQLAQNAGGMARELASQDSESPTKQNG